MADDDHRTAIEVKPDGYLKRSERSRSGRPRVVLDFECRRLARSDPDPQEPPLTGRTWKYG
jgi:hypothetical protein